ncbi:MAG: hypothetical protein QXP55_03065 [Nitrososphaerales archaeon]
MRVEKLTGVKMPEEVIEVSLEPSTSLLCIRFKKPSEAELGEPIHPQIHLYRDKDTEEITALEIISPEEFSRKVSNVFKVI